MFSIAKMVTPKNEKEKKKGRNRKKKGRQCQVPLPAHWRTLESLGLAWLTKPRKEGAPVAGNAVFAPAPKLGWQCGRNGAHCSQRGCGRTGDSDTDTDISTHRGAARASEEAGRETVGGR
jgi:hypothetical protein